MNKHQERFLTDLDHLLREYSIDTVLIRGSVANKDPLRIAFFSNDRELSFIEYRDGAFLTVYSETPRFEPQEQNPIQKRECKLCKYLQEKTPSGCTVKDCGWCIKKERSVLYNAEDYCREFEEGKKNADEG